MLVVRNAPACSPGCAPFDPRASLNIKLCLQDPDEEISRRRGAQATRRSPEEGTLKLQQKKMRHSTYLRGTFIK